MKDGQLLTIEGVYSETQTIVDRAAATYDNVLIIDDKDSNVFGSTYTCSVNNVLGSDKQSLKIEKRELRIVAVPVQVILSMKERAASAWCIFSS